MAATIDHDAKAGQVVVMEKTDKRDFLVDIERRTQSLWQQENIFETDPAPLPSGVDSYSQFFESGHSMADVHKEHPKWFGTFPYPYMNGSLHLGHTFTISKVEFAAGYERMKGKRVLFPLGYHVTGMPIKASADKLIDEMRRFGEDFSGYREEDDAAAAPPTVPTPTPAKALESVDVSKGKKGKLNAKSTGLQYQFQILDLIGIPRDEIKQFADTNHWLEFFPPIAKEDLTKLGARIDWRRQFLTTPANPYYDSFVRWQMNRLHGQKKVKFGKRYTIYSIKDKQPCMDHDRKSGEALGPQEYTAVKMEVLEWGPSVPESFTSALGGKKVFMVAATLRPETMYGQTNCFVGPPIEYGLFEAADGALYLVTNRAARNMMFQDALAGEKAEPQSVINIKGAELLGTKVRPPFGLVPEVFVLPMEGVLETKGTGVVTSVPSDSPDDYRTLMDLRKKADMYKIKPEWAAIDPIPVLATPKYGDMAAEVLCQQLKIQSQRDVKQLAEAKDLAYKEGFYNGKMTVGDFKGETVADAKPKVRQQMIDAGLALAYAEPEGEIVSRSEDKCIVALADQWYLDYGEESWKATTKELLAQMNTYSSEITNAFEGVLDWLNQWACARAFGLGSKLPWDPVWLVESLSDSTIYMSYYTVANLLHQDMWGKQPGPLGITADQMTDEVWDYVLGNGTFPSESAIPVEKAAQLKYSFRYFYPFDLRSSAKDLVNNHLTFCMYNHAALFPRELWPKAMRLNGHLLLNGKKMSKSTGNFLTLREAADRYGADAMRLSLADGGDEITDANFEETVANASILRLHTAVLWAEEMKSSEPNMRTGEYNDFDRLFQAEMNGLIEACSAAYENMEYKVALKRGLYDFEIARNWYRLICNPENGGPGMHRDLVFGYIRASALLIAPFVPHFAEHIWRNILGEKGTVQNAPFPQPSSPVDPVALQQQEYMRGVVDSLRGAELQLTKKKGKAQAAASSYDPSKPKDARVYVATQFPDWQTQCVETVKKVYSEANRSVDNKKLKEELQAIGLIKDKRVMPFCATFIKEVETNGSKAFGRTLPFSELDALRLLLPLIKASLKYEDCFVVSVDDARQAINSEGEKQGWSLERAEASEPGRPSVQFWNVQ